jgi:hypothetical protein
MSHHFDVKRAKQDPSLNVCDAYLFKASPGHTVMAMTVNADAGIGSPDYLPSEALYAFRFDLNGDAREEVVFKLRLGEPHHLPGNEHTHVQTFRFIRAEGAEIAGDAGKTLVEGRTGSVATDSGIRAFVGVSPELWAADAIAFFNLLTALYKENRFDGDVFLHRKNFFRNRNVIAIILEVPNELIGRGKVRLWATASLYGHAPEVQICRWGLPLFTHLFLSDAASTAAAEEYHASVPADDVEQFAGKVAAFTAKLSGLAGSTPRPDDYGQQVAARLCPVMLPYELGTDATFDLQRFNGRPLHVDAYDVMLTLAANKPIVDGVSPDHSKIRAEFPYYGTQYTQEEQADLEAISTGFYE